MGRGGRGSRSCLFKQSMKLVQCVYCSTVRYVVCIPSFMGWFCASRKLVRSDLVFGIANLCIK